MRKRINRTRNYTLNTKKRKKVSDNKEPFDVPTPSEQEAAYKCTVSKEHCPIWVKCVVL